MVIADTAPTDAGNRRGCDKKESPTTEASLTRPNINNLSAGDAEWFDQIAVMKRAGSAGTSVAYRAQQDAEANGLEQLAAALRNSVVRDMPVLHQGRGGEIAPADNPDLPWRQREIAQTVGAPSNMLSADASLARLNLARDAGVLTLAVEAAESVNATTSVQQMLCHSLSATHKLAMNMLGTAANELHKHQVAAHVNPGALTEATRAANAGARLLAAFSQGAIALDRLRNGHHQTMTVQYVNIEDGGQAIIAGRVSPGKRVGEVHK